MSSSRWPAVSSTPTWRVPPAAAVKRSRPPSHCPSTLRRTANSPGPAYGEGAALPCADRRPGPPRRHQPNFRRSRRPRRAPPDGSGRAADRFHFRRSHRSRRRSADRLATPIAELRGHLPQPKRLDRRIRGRLLADPLLKRIQLRPRRRRHVPRRHFRTDRLRDLSRASPVSRATSRCERPSTSTIRLISAHRSTPTTHSSRSPEQARLTAHPDTTARPRPQVA